MNATKLLRAGPQLDALFHQFEAVRKSSFDCLYSVQRMQAQTAMNQFKDMKAGVDRLKTTIAELERELSDDNEMPPVTS